MRREPLRHQQRSKRINILLLVTIRVSTRITRTCRRTPRIVIRHIGRQSPDRGWTASGFVEVAEELSCGCYVGGPAQPPCMAGVEVHGDVGKVELRDGVGGTFFVGGVGIGTFGDAEVCYEVGEGIGFFSSSAKLSSDEIKMKEKNSSPTTRITLTSE